MAKVKIQGNASGTGVLTVTAPNTSTDRTITLPDATGTLATTDINSFTGDTTITSGDIVFATAGKGICLGVTSNTDANTLDDYEEGTWTPHVYVDSSHSGIVYAGNQGTYTKIGNTVSCHAAIQLSNKGSSSGNVTIRNFPYAIEDWSSYTSTDGGSVTIGYVAGTSGLSDLKLAGNQANYIQGFVRTNSTGDVTGTFTNSHITNGFSLRISFHYQTA